MIGDFLLNSENDSGNQESQADASDSFFLIPSAQLSAGERPEV